MRLAQARPSVDEQRVQMRFARGFGNGDGHGIRHAVRVADDEVLERERRGDGVVRRRLTGLAAIGRDGLQGGIFRVGSNGCRSSLLPRCACGSSNGGSGCLLLHCGSRCCNGDRRRGCRLAGVGLRCRLGLHRGRRFGCPHRRCCGDCLLCGDGIGCCRSGGLRCRLRRGRGGCDRSRGGRHGRRCGRSGCGCRCGCCCRSRCSLRCRSLRFVDADEHVERHPANLFEGALDAVDVMAFDEVLDEFRISGQHHEPVACGLGK